MQSVKNEHVPGRSRLKRVKDVPTDAAGASSREVPSRGTERIRRWYVLCACVGFTLIYVLVGNRLGQDVDFDLVNYHYFDPYWLLVDHMHDAAPAFLQSYYSPFLDIPFYFAARDLPSWNVGLLVAIVQSLSFPILYLIARRFVHSRLLSLLFAGIGMFTSGAITELGTIMGDTITAPLILGGVLLGLKAVEEPTLARVFSTNTSEVLNRSDRRLARHARAGLRCALLSGVLVGVAAGLKLSGLPLALAAVLALTAVAGPLRRRLTLAVASGVGLVFGVVVSYGWWGYEMVVKFRNPVFPYLNQLFHSPYAPLSANTDTSSRPHGLVEILFYPFVWNANASRVNDTGLVELTGPVLEVLLLLVLVKGVAMAVRKRHWSPLFASDSDRYLVSFAVVGYFIWVIDFGYYRYFIPVEMLGVLLIFVVGRNLVHDVVPKKVATVAFAVLVVVILATERVGYVARPSWSPKYFTVAVPKPLRTERAAFLMAGSYPSAYVVPSFPADDYFARIERTVTSTPTFRKVIESQLAQYDKVYLMWIDPVAGYSSDARFMRRDAKSWKRYGFTLVPNSCQLVIAKVGSIREGVNVCSLERTNTLLPNPYRK